jgi:hypothetical protein
MRKLLIAAVLASVPFAGFAQHHGHRHHHHGGGWGWVAPAVIGGAVVYGLTRPAPVVVQQPPIVYIDGVAYSKQWVQINGQLQEVLVRM